MTTATPHAGPAAPAHTTTTTTTAPQQPKHPIFDALAVATPANGKVVAAAATVGALFDLAVRSGGLDTVAAALTFTGIAVGLTATKRVTSPHGKTLAALGGLFGVLLAYRTSPWLVLPNLVVTTTLLTLAASIGPNTKLLDLSIPRLITRLAATGYHQIAAPAFLATARPRRSPSTAAVRGVILAGAVVVVFGALLASADAVFASLFKIPGDAEDIVVHATAIATGMWAMTGLLRSASSGTAEPGAWPRRLSTTEANAVLGALVGLFATFAVTQVVTAAGGADHVLRNQGLTYAEYARSGYFQLLFVAALTAAVLLAIRAATDLTNAKTKSTLALAETAVALIIVIVGVALYRLDLYEDAFGLTMLRLYCEVFAVWIALVFVLIGIALTGYAGHRHWLPAAATTVGLVMLLALNVANPEALVVKRNVARERLDTAYLATLSDDAVPALDKAGLAHLHCPPRTVDRPHTGWAAANWSRAQANGVRKRADVCHP